MKTNVSFIAHGLVLALLSAVFLAGCFGPFKKQEAANPAAPAGAPDASSAYSPASSGDQADQQVLSSFADGEIYLRALEKKDPAECGRIQNENLKTRCTEEVSPREAN